MSLFVKFIRPLIDSVSTIGPRYGRTLASRGNQDVGSHIPSDMHSKSESNIRAYIKKVEQNNISAQIVAAEEVSNYEKKNEVPHNIAWKKVVVKSMKHDGNVGSDEQLIEEYDELQSVKKIYGNDPRTT